MIFTCDRGELTEAISNISKAAAVKSTYPLIEGIYMKAERGSVYLCCYNLEIGITKTISATVTETGAAVLPQKLSEIVRKLPNDRVSVTIDEKYMARIVSGASDFGLVGQRADEYPELPQVDTEHSIDLPQPMLKSAISQVSYAVSTQENAPAIYKGVYFETEGDMLNLVALDGYRLAVRHDQISPVEENYSFIVPGKTLNEVQKVLSEGEDEPVHINVATNNILFSANGYTVVSRLISGDYVNYRSTISGETKYSVSVRTSDLVSCAERMAVVNSETYKSPVRCYIGGNAIKMECDTPIGRAEEVIGCQCDCEDFVIGFNNRYMLDAFRAVDTDEVLIKLSTPVSPAHILPPEGDSFLFLLLPVRLTASQG